MKTTFTLELSIIELAQYTAELYRQGINFKVEQQYQTGYYTFTLTGY